MKKKFILIVASLAIGITGCKKDFLNLQKNPNLPSSANPDFVLSAALNASAYDINTQYSEFGVWAGYWVSSGNYVPSPQLQQYVITTDNYSGVWSTLYNNLANYNSLVVSANADKTLANYGAISTIMEAYVFEQLVDIFNDVPYSQAFEPTVTITPTYDKGSAVYDAIFKSLDGAIATAKAGGTGNIVGDIVFGGNMPEWAKFANTLKLRIALRQFKNIPAKDAALSASITATAGVGYIDGTFEADANPGYANIDANGGQQSPFELVYGFNAAGNAQGSEIYYRANNFAISELKSFTDPRLEQFYTLTVPVGSSAAPYEVLGLDLGTGAPVANSNISGIGAGLLKSPTMNAVLMSSAEALFLQSEAVEEGLLTSGDAQTLYQAGITASFEALGLTDAQASDYYGQATANVGWAASTGTTPNALYDAKVEAIITQKWIALNGYGNLEGFNELRRTGFPVGVPASVDPAAVSKFSPLRLLYPTSEYSNNPKSVAAEGTINIFTDKPFWMTLANYNNK